MWTTSRRSSRCPSPLQLWASSPAAARNDVHQDDQGDDYHCGNSDYGNRRDGDDHARFLSYGSRTETSWRFQTEGTFPNKCGGPVPSPHQGRSGSKPPALEVPLTGTSKHSSFGVGA